MLRGPAKAHTPVKTTIGANSGPTRTRTDLAKTFIMVGKILKGHRRLRFVFLAAGLILAASDLNAANLCRSLFAPDAAFGPEFSVKNLDDRYRHAREMYPQVQPRVIPHPRRLEVQKLLQEAFYPLVVKVATLPDLVNREKILKVHQDLMSTTPIRQKRYSFAFKFPYGFYPKKPYFYQYNPEIPYADVGEPTPGSTVSKQVLGNVKSGMDRAQILEHPEIDRVSEFLWIKPQSGRVSELGNKAHEQFGLVITPIGEYGVEFSRKLLLTSEIMMELIYQSPSVRQASKQLMMDSPHLLLSETARARAQGADALKNEDLAPLSSTIEGVLSLHQLLTILLSKKIPGIENGQIALNQIIFNGGDPQLGLIADATSRFRMGFIGPMTMAGLHFKSGLVHNLETGRIELSKGAKDALKDFILEEPTRKSRCPMAALWKRAQSIFDGKQPVVEKAGVQLLAETYWEIFKIVDALPASPSGN